MLKILNCLILLNAVIFVSAYLQFQSRIPNGDRVVHPCLANRKWPGVGHMQMAGAGSRNQFGKDFAAAGHRWTRALCLKDSDSDGRTNGEELGDPNCSWQEGLPTPDVSQGSKITHPGICEPLNTPTCERYNLANAVTNMCEDTTKFNCPRTKAGGVESFDLTRKNESIPATVTNYICQAFHAPNVTKSLIGYEALIDNQHVMHHIILYGCDTKPTDSLFTNPAHCVMARTCINMVALWSVGIPGYCWPDDVGIRVGPGTDYKYFILEAHLNNPLKESHYYDATTLKLYLTSQKQANDAGIIAYGQRYINIPPRQLSHSVNGSISAQFIGEILRRNGRQSINIFAGIHHLHDLGRYGSMEIVDANGNIQLPTLMSYQPSVYDRPVTKNYNPPIQLKVGDSIKISCVYKTLHLNYSTYYGEGTHDEMCWGFLQYYPKINGRHQIWAQYDQYLLTIPGPRDLKYGCNLDHFNASLANPVGISNQLNDMCDITISNVCLPACEAVVRELLKHPCMSGAPRKYLDYRGDQSFRNLRLQIAPCEIKILGGNLVGGPNVVNAATKPTACSENAILLMIVAMFIGKELLC